MHNAEDDVCPCRMCSAPPGHHIDVTDVVDDRTPLRDLNLREVFGCRLPPASTSFRVLQTDSVQRRLLDAEGE